MKNNMKNTLLTIIISFLIQAHAFSQEARRFSEIYKKKDTVDLTIRVIYPPSMDKSKNHPGMVFFSGGNWNYGRIYSFTRHANYFAKRGVVCFLAEYGIKDTKGPRFWECIADAKSAIRYIRKNADRFKVDSNMIIAAGGSAGGHLASATAIISCCEEPENNDSTDSKPNALVLFNPAVDLGPGDPGLFESAGERYIEISPLQNVRPGAPPAIVLQGTDDKITPVETIKYFKHVMEAAGSRCELFLYDGQEHGFFNFGRGYYKQTVLEVDRFLISLGYIDGEPTIMNGN